MISLYLHIPFCLTKCPYCDFFSVTDRPDLFAAYPRLLLKQARLARMQGWRGPLRSIFFGGGTPSLLPPAAISSLVTGLKELFGATDEIEISLEANPGTLDAERLAGYRSAGVNRLSLGIQTLDDAQLRQLGRRHDAAQAREAVALARAAGFDNLGIDLMFGLPGESAATLGTTLDEVLGWQPEHLSVYGLTIEPDTPFARQHQAGRLSLPDENLAAEAFLAIHRTLAAAGYDHYEISNYARPGQECRHNLNYWRRGPYLGLGAGAHSLVDRGWGERRAAANDLDAYRRALDTGLEPSQLLEDFDREGAMRETVYLGLRTAEGLSEATFRQRFGLGLATAFPEAVDQLAGQLALRKGRWSLDWTSWLLFDHLIQAFF